MEAVTYTWTVTPPDTTPPARRPTLRERFLAGYRRRRYPRPPAPVLHVTPDANGDVHLAIGENGVLPAFTVEGYTKLHRIVAHPPTDRQETTQ